MLLGEILVIQGTYSQDWLLYDTRSSSGIGARGLSNGEIYNRAGQLVCTVVQEGYLGRG